MADRWPLVPLIRGTLSRFFRLGPGGPLLRMESDGGLGIRTGSDAAYQFVRGAQPAASDDMVTLGYANSGYAPIGVGYVCVANDGTLTAERRLQVAGPQLTLVDGGANGDLTLNTGPDLIALEAIAVARGTIPVGNSTPAWAGLVAGTNGNRLLADSTAAQGVRWVAGSDGVQVTRAAGAGNGTQAVSHSLGYAPARVDFVGSNDGALTNGSQGIAHGTGARQSCQWSNLGVAQIDLGNCLHIETAGNGWTATVTAVSATTFTLTWVQVGVGLNVTIDCYPMA